MKTLIQLLTERKQVGTIYHYTNLKNCISILKFNQMLSNQVLFKHQDGNRYDVISFTRNKNFHKAPYGRTIGADVECRLTIDGDRLSDKYKLRPYSESGFSRQRSQEYESEVRIQSLSSFAINNIIKYIKSIEILEEQDTKTDRQQKLIQICEENNIPVSVIDKNGNPTKEF